MTIDAIPLLDEFFEAIVRRDRAALDRIYADDLEVWHNVTGRTMDKATNLALLDRWATAVEGMRYEVLERRSFEGGAVQRHVVHGAGRGGPIRAEVAIVFHFGDGRITRIFEYLDQSAVAGVF